MESLILLDYDTLRHIWWLLLGVLLIAFAVMDGADLGVAMLLPLVTRGKSIATPKSAPSMTAKAIKSTPSSSHQI